MPKAPHVHVKLSFSTLGGHRQECFHSPHTDGETEVGVVTCLGYLWTCFVWLPGFLPLSTLAWLRTIKKRSILDYSRLFL